MKGTTRFVLLNLGLCLVFCCVNAGHVRVYGTGFFGEHEEQTGWLARLKKRETTLENLIRSAKYRVDRYNHELDLQDVRASIAQIEATSRVPYKDYIQSLSGERKQFEKEKVELRKQLVQAENNRLQAVDALESQNKSRGAEVASYQEKLKSLTEQRNKIAKQYALFVEKFSQEEEKMKEERNQFLTEKGKFQQTLETAKGMHAQALDAVSASPTEGYKPISIPEQDEINKLRNDLKELNGMKDRKQLKKGLETTRTKLEELLNKMYKAGKFSPKTTNEDLKNAMSEMEKNTMLKREEKETEKTGLVDKIKKKDLADYDEEEIAYLQKTNQEVVAVDTFQKEIARRNAYLKGILEVSDLLKECSEAIRDANERNLATMWADAIHEAADSPLAKVWAQSLQDAKDSELAKAWADAIQDATNSKLAKVWTNAIQEAKDINLAQAWTDAVQNVKNSPLAKIWTDTVKNAKDSPFTKYCTNAIQDAKNSLCQIVSSK